MRRLFVIAVALFALVAARGVPDLLMAGEFDAADGRVYYHKVVTTVLREGYSSDVRLRILVTSTMGGEGLVGVRLGDGGFEVISLRPTLFLQDYEMLRDLKDESFNGEAFGIGPEERAMLINDLEARLPRDYRDVPVKRCTAAISEQTARRLTAAWERVLSEAAAAPRSDEHVVLDGASFHFWVRGNREYGGNVYSPDSSWPSGRLATTGSKMFEYCKTPTAATSQELDRLADEVK